MGSPRKILLSPKDSRQYLGPLDLNCLQGSGIQSQRLQNSRSNLRRLNRDSKGFGRKARVRYKDHHVRVVVGEPAMFGLLRCAAGVRHTYVRSNDDVRSSGITVWRNPRIIE